MPNTSRRGTAWRRWPWRTDYLGIPTTPPDLESVDRIETFFKALRDAGFSGEEVEAVAWRNAYRVLREALD
jgi:membrane dipeptidase